MEIQCRICGEDIPIDYIKTHIQLAHENESLYLGSPENGEKKEKEEKEECLEENITYDIVQSRLRGVTSDFLQNLCSDFLRLRELLDIDQKLMKKLIKHIRSSVKSRIRNKKLAAVYRLPSQFLNKMIKGPLQGKKTWTIISIALYNLIQYKMSTIIVVEESIDSRKQMATRFGEVFEDYQKHMKKNGIKIPFSKEYFRILESKNVSDREICDSMTTEKPKIIIVLRSESNMKHLQKTIEKSPNKRFTLIIDESDAIDNASTCKAQKCLQNLKNSASSIFNVSATPMTTLCNNDIIQENTFVMSTPENYKGLNVIQIEQLPEEAFCSNNKDDDPFERDKNLMLFLEKFSQKPIFKDVHISSRCDMPAICLMHLGRTIDPQLKIVNFVHEKFPKKITTVTYNETVELRGETLPKVPIQIILPSGKSRFTKYENGIHKIKSIHIGDILAYLQSQGIKNHPRILILAGCLASRGISFWANNKEECMKKKQISWHLCMMYFLAADNTNQPNLQQTAGRLAGIYDDNIPLILYTNVKEDLIKAFNAQEELVKRAKEKELETLGFMREAISKVEITREKISKRGIVANGVKCNLNKVDDDTEFGGENWLEKIEEKEEKIDPTRAVEGLVYTVSPDNVKETWRAVVSDIIDKIDEADRWVSRPSIVKKLWATDNYESLPGLRGTLTQIQQSVKGTNTIGYGLNFRKKKNSEDIELLYHA